VVVTRTYKGESITAGKADQEEDADIDADQLEEGEGTGIAFEVSEKQNGQLHCRQSNANSMRARKKVE
jgi:hypothetical protein